MFSASVTEWGALDVAEDGRAGALPRRAADALLAAARALELGGDDGERILTDGRHRIRAQQVVGVLCAPNARLEILPKIDGEDPLGVRKILVNMLARVFDLDVADGRITELDFQRFDLLEIVIKSFCSKLFEVVRRGLPRRYLQRDDDLRALRGRLDIKRQFTTLATSPQALACRYDDLDADIALNQVMKALVRALSVASRSDTNQRNLRELALAFADVRDVPVHALPWQDIVVDRTNQGWAELVALARFLLRGQYQTTSAGALAGFSLLFPMHILFEEYVGRCLQTAVHRDGARVQLQGPRDFILVDGAGARRFATKPDIVVFRGAHPSLVIDTKWKQLSSALDDPKRGVAQADVYQMLAYARVYRVPRLVLLYPHHKALGDEDGPLARFRFSGGDDAELTIATIRLTRADVASRLRELAA